MVNNAAKDDVITEGGSFTIADLLANDPGGANKLAGHFFFGETSDYSGVNFAAGNIPTIQQQLDYLAHLGVTALDDTTDLQSLDGVHFTASFEAAENFSYSVQIGNKGTWSSADVGIKDATPHVGQSLFTENFEGYNTDSNVVNAGGAYEVVVANMANDNGGAATGGWAGATATSVELGGANYGGVLANNSHWSDTQSTVDGVSGLSDTGQISMSHGFTDPTGGSVQLSFDIGKQDYSALYVTDPNATFEFRVDGNVVKTITAGELTTNQLSHFDVVVDGLTAGAHTLELVDTTEVSSNVGFAIDNIAIHDWIA